MDILNPVVMEKYTVENVNVDMDNYISDKGAEEIILEKHRHSTDPLVYGDFIDEPNLSLDQYNKIINNLKKRGKIKEVDLQFE